MAELPDDVSEWEARKELEPTVREACQEIKSREAEGDRRAHKANFVRQGIAEVTSYLLELHNLREISDDDYWDSGFRADLREAVRSELESELSGHEAARQVTELARAIVNDHLDE